MKKAIFWITCNGRKDGGYTFERYVKSKADAIRYGESETKRFPEHPFRLIAVEEPKLGERISEFDIIE